MMLLLRVALGLAVELGIATTAASAAETITYKYDAKGRLTTVTRSGSVNNGVNVSITHDRADNRKRVVTTGASR